MDYQVLLAPNPGLFTGPGTNTYVLRESGRALIVDPGPIENGHELPLLEATDADEVVGVLVTHSHPDHAPLANPIGKTLGVPVYGHSPGPQFDPDLLLADGDLVSLGESGVEVVHTPGHANDHLCFLVGDLLFTGDHIMGGSTVVVEDMLAYLASLQRLAGMQIRRLLPGHGPEMDDPYGVIDEYITHRLEREMQILAAIERGATSVGTVVEDVYRDVDRALHPLAAHSVAAHLRKLVVEGRVVFSEQTDLWSSLVRMIGAADD